MKRCFHSLIYSSRLIRPTSLSYRKFSSICWRLYAVSGHRLLGRVRAGPLGPFHTDASTRSERSRRTTGVYVYRCAFTLARVRALAEITRANVRVHSRCQRSARAFARVTEQEVSYLSIISINFFTYLLSIIVDFLHSYIFRIPEQRDSARLRLLVIAQKTNE